jgi:oligopeptide transport system substrate-binding protein
MSKKTWLILILVLVCLCMLGGLCATATYLGWTHFTFRVTTPSGVSSRATSTPRSGGTLRLYGGLPPTLDPALVQDSTSAEYVVHLFSGLVTLNSDLEVVPDIAERWEISPDGRTYTFHLLPEATFADGRPITAEDFIYSFERACSPKLQSPVGEAYLGDIVGVSAFAAGQAEHIAGLKALDAHTLQVTIDAPKAYFLAKLTYSTAFVVDRVQIEQQGSTWTRKPNGSGPFVLETLSRERIALTRNERYYGRKPALERVEYVLSGGMPITMYENDQLDMVEVPPSEIERVLDPENPLYAEHHMVPELSVQYLGLNVAQPPFDDLAVRQALAQAIDKEKLATLVLKGTATAAKGILPPALPGYDPELAGLPYDPENARKLLASSRYAGQMPPIVLTVSGTSGHMDVTTRAVLSMLQENLGLELTVEQVAWEDFLRDLNERRYQLFLTGWIADYPDPQNFLDLLFHSTSSQNHTGYRNSQVDQWLEQARVESDPARRMALYHQAERVIVSEAPWIPLTHGVSYTLVKPYVQGYRTSAAIYPWLKEISIATTED